MSVLTLAALGELVESVRTWDPSRSDAGVFKYIDIGAVDQDAKNISGEKTLPCSEAPSRARQIVAGEDVLVSTVRPNLNAVAIVPSRLDGATASTGFCVLRARRSRLDPRYLFQWVKCAAFVEDMTRKATGASYPAVSDRIVLESRIPLPPLSEQRRIAAIMDKADALRTKRRESLVRLDGVTQAIFLDIFGDPATNPKGWPMKPLATLIRPGDTINYGVVQPGEEVADGVALIRVGDLSDGRIRLSAMRRISRQIDAQYQRSRLKGDEILISCVGTTGVVALADESVRGFNIARAVARVPLNDAVSRPYVYAFLQTEAVQRYFRNELRTVSQPTLNIKQISETQVLLPPIYLQTKFARHIGAVERLKESQRSSESNIGSLFASLQHRAFRGEL